MRQFRSGSIQRTAGISALAIAASLFALAPGCLAQSNTPENNAPPATQAAPQDGADSAMVPARARIRVVRLSDVEGTVQILRGNQTEFSQAVMNMPLTQGSRLVTSADSRAEIEFEDGSVARITPNSSLTISDLQSTPDGALDTTVEQLSGLIYYELRSDPKTPFKVVFNGRTASPITNSTFRINLSASSQDLAVIDGKVQVAGDSSSYLTEVPQGKTIQFAPSANEQYTIANWIAPNGFYDWNQQRDQEAAQQAKNQTPARVQQGGGSIMDSGFGWSDLDNSGAWYPLPGYGMVWQPYDIGADFDPYGNGMWADMGGGFGYSWISGYPWGWLPFNCGAWSYIGSFGWGWTPGMYGCGGFGIGYGFGGYGGYGRYGYGRWRNHQYPHTNIHGAPPGYHAPVPPAIVKGQTPQRLVRVGNQRTMATRATNFHAGSGSAGRVNARPGNIGGRPVKFNGEKIAPLHSMMTGVNVPSRNAALYNNYPAHAFRGDLRGTLMNHNVGAGLGGNRMGLRGNGVGLRANAFHGNGVAPGMRRPGPVAMNRSRTMNVERGERMANHAFGGANRATFGQHASFSQHPAFGTHTSFGPHGSFGGRSAFAGAGFHGGSMGRVGGFSGGSFHGMGRAGGFSGGNFHGGGMGRPGGSSGGFHGSGGGFHGGGGGFQSGSGGGFQGGGGGFHGGGGGIGGGSHGGGGGHGGR